MKSLMGETKGPQIDLAAKGKDGGPLDEILSQIKEMDGDEIADLIGRKLAQTEQEAELTGAPSFPPEMLLKLAKAMGVES